MAYSYEVYPSLDGSVTDFAVPFGYINRTHVTALVDGVSAPFTWLTSGMIRMNTAPVGNLTIARETPKLNQLVTFTDGSTQSAELHNTQNLQLLYVTQEAFDSVVTVLRGDGVEWDAEGQKITNLADPTDPQDAVTKYWAETGMTSQLQQAISLKNDMTVLLASGITAKDAAVVARLAAEAAQLAAEAAQTAAETAQGITEGARDAALGYRNTAQTHANTATTKATQAAGSATTATTQAGIATTKANEASGSATTASTQAGIATTKANEAAGHAADALASASSINDANLVHKTGAETINGIKTMQIVRQPLTTVTPATTITLNLATSNRFKITLNQNVTIANPTNAVAGQSILITLKQDATGSRLVSWGGRWKFPTGVAPTLTTDANKVDVIVGEVLSSTEILCSAILNFG